MSEFVGDGNTKTPGIHGRLGGVIVTAGFPWGKQQEYPMGEISTG